MKTLQIDILNPKATQLLEDLAALDLITIRQNGGDDFQQIINKLRANADDAPSFEETTAEVEAVRAERHAKKLIIDAVTAYINVIDTAMTGQDFNKSGLKGYSLDLANFVDIVSKELMRQSLNKSIELAEKYGISKMSINDINQEVKAVRDKRYEEQQLAVGLQTVLAGSQAFSFLQDDDDIYSVDDLKAPHDE